MHCKVEEIGVDPMKVQITLSSDALFSVDVTPNFIIQSINYQ